MAPDPKPLFTSDFDDRVNRLLKDWHVPGIAIAIIDDTETQSKGYGFAALPDVPVTPDTAFFTASTTKAFTAASLSILIREQAAKKSELGEEETKLSWQTPISSVIRDDFVLDHPISTSQVTFEDALTHRTGIPDHKYSFKPKTYGLRDAVRRLRHLPRGAKLRVKFFYSSYMYSVVSHAIETVTGKGLGEFMKEKIWQPLGMTRTFWTPQQALDANESDGTVLATGYAWNAASESFVEEPRPDFPGVSGAGGMISTVNDYAKWLRCMMTQSQPISKAGHRQLITPRTNYTNHGLNPFSGNHAYCLGWIMDYYRGERILWHGGSWIGFGSHILYLPDRQWGVVMMGNTFGTSNCIQQVLFMHLLDELLDTPVSQRVNWEDRMTQRFAQKREDHASALTRLYPNLPSPVLSMSLPLKQYAGTYHNAGYGVMKFEVQGDKLVADRRDYEIGMVVRMAHVSGEFWMATLETVNQDPREYDVVRAEFRLTADGVASYLGMDLEPALGGKMILFNRIE